MKKLLLGLLTVSFISFLIYSCTKNETIQQKTEVSNLKLAKNVENLSHLNNLLNNSETFDLINSKYNINLQEVKGMYNFEKTKDNILSDQYIFIIPSVLKNSTNVNVTHNIVITCILSEAKAIIMEETKTLLSNGNYEVNLNLFNNEPNDGFNYIVNKDGILLERWPCKGNNSWWDCMTCCYYSYTSDLVGQLTWVPAGVNVATVYCLLKFPQYKFYTKPA